MPAMDERAYRRTMGGFATGVALVTASVEGDELGLVVNSLSSVSLHPPLVSFSPARDSRTWQRMRTSGRFGVNVLAEHHDAYVRRAAPPGADRFAGIAHERTATGVPVLGDALAFLECAIEAEHAAGDHWIVIGRVERVVRRDDARPLVFWGGDFGRLEPAALRAA